MPDEKVKITVLQPIVGQKTGLNIVKKFSKHKVLLTIFGIALALIIGAISGGVIWYNSQISPLGSDVNQTKLVTITSGSISDDIGKQLEKESIIRSATAFRIYVKYFLGDKVMQAGTYRLSSAKSVPQIVDTLVKGAVDRLNILFYPGAKLVGTDSKSNKYDVTSQLKKAGYSDQKISAAFKKTYESPLFKDKPAGTDLEGYVYGQTYSIYRGESVESVLKGTFDEFYKVIKANGLIEGFASHGLNLYQGITLASIIQREASTAQDQKQVAQVFYSRLESGMTLGSDVTYQYICDKLGVPRDEKYDSPYNTRLYPGLPTGPIAVPGLSALLAASQPAEGDYLYFLSDSDGVLYFAYTLAEHEENIADHCKEACIAP